MTTRSNIWIRFYAPLIAAVYLATVGGYLLFGDYGVKRLSVSINLLFITINGIPMPAWMGNGAGC